MVNKHESWLKDMKNEIYNNLYGRYKIESFKNNKKSTAGFKGWYY